MGLLERLAMREKGLMEGDWRDESGRGLAEASKRRDVRAMRECIVDGSLPCFLKVACDD